MRRQFLVLFIGVCAVLGCAAQNVGDTAASVETVLGHAPMVRKTSTGEIWVYGNGVKVTLARGVVVAIEGVSKDAGVYPPIETMSVVPERVPPKAAAATPSEATPPRSARRDVRDAMPGWLVFAMGAAALVAFASNVVILIRAFKAHLLWGLGSMFVPLVSLVFVVLHWSDVKKPFLFALGSSVLIVVLAFFGVTVVPFQS